MAFRRAYEFPAEILRNMIGLVLGDYARHPMSRSGKAGVAGEIRMDHRGNPVTNRGLLGFALDFVKFLVVSILDGTKYAGRTVTNFLHNHSQAIATAFWASLVLGGAAALTVFLWPAALTAVTTFSIAGFSIAGIVGTGVGAQIGAVAAVAAVAANVAVYTTAAVVNTFRAIGSYFSSRSTSEQTSGQEFSSGQAESSSQTMARLGRGSNTPAPARTRVRPEGVEEEPVHTPTRRSLFNSNTPTPSSRYEPENNENYSPYSSTAAR